MAALGVVDGEGEAFFYRGEGGGGVIRGILCDDALIFLSARGDMEVCRDFLWQPWWRGSTTTVYVRVGLLELSTRMAIGCLYHKEAPDLIFWRGWRQLWENVTCMYCCTLTMMCVAIRFRRSFIERAGEEEGGVGLRGGLLDCCDASLALGPVDH